MSRAATTAKHYATIVVLAVIGVATAGYVIAHQGGGLKYPGSHRYEIRIELESAAGVTPGIGQPVNVAGVEVGTIVGAKLNARGNAVVTVEFRASELPRVYSNATATLRPVTPLKDMSIDLAPGGAPAPPLPDGGLLSVAHTEVGADLSGILRALDSDARDYLQVFISSLAEATKGQGATLRRTFTLLGPTVAQANEISSALDARRVSLARMVHNLNRVMTAATPDHAMARVIRAGNQTLEAVATQGDALRDAISQLPGTLAGTRTMLDDTAAFADQLRPAAEDLTPIAKALPRTLTGLSSFGDATAKVVKTQLRPLVAEAHSPVKHLSAATTGLNGMARPAAQTLQVLNYALNVFAYNPPGDDEGGLFWLDWFAHNMLSTFSTSDAHGSLGRAMVVSSCQNLASLADASIAAVLAPALGLTTLCPK